MVGTAMDGAKGRLDEDKMLVMSHQKKEENERTESGKRVSYDSKFRFFSYLRAWDLTMFKT